VRNERNVQFTSRIQTNVLQLLDQAKYEASKGSLDELRSDSQWYTYNMNCCHRNNHYGPYLVRGQIDWFQVQALANVIRMNLMELCGVWVDTHPPVGLEATRAYLVIRAACRVPADWACVHGRAVQDYDLNLIRYDYLELLLYHFDQLFGHRSQGFPK